MLKWGLIQSEKAQKHLSVGNLGPKEALLVSVLRVDAAIFNPQPLSWPALHPPALLLLPPSFLKN